MIVEVVTEVLDVADGRLRNSGVREMTREQDEGHIADILGLSQVGQMLKFQRGVPSCVEDLRRALDGRETSGIDKFLACW